MSTISTNRLSRRELRKDRRKKRREGRRIRSFRFFWEFLRCTLGKFLSLQQNWQAENVKLLSAIDPPYLIMPNHNSMWDPFIIGYFSPHPIHYVAADAVFRSPLTRFLLELIGAIPKTKVLSDLEPVQQIIKIRRQGGVIGIFPEGQSPWDGHTLPLIQATAKLIKLLKIPVIIPIVKGSFLSKPRWAKRRRFGVYSVSFSLGFSKEEVKMLSTEEILDKLENLLAYDEYDFQKKRMVTFKGKDRAEYLEFALFLCPQCHGISSLRSHGDLYTCRSCGYEVFYNEFGFFEKRCGNLVFDSVRTWNLWQVEYLEKLIDEWRKFSPSQLLIEDEGVRMYIGYKDEPLEYAGKGKIRLFSDTLLFIEDNGEKAEFPLQEIRGANIQNNEKLEFYYRDELYRFDGRKNRISVYKWFLVMTRLQVRNSISGSS